ncbi:MAG: hypothetical protein A2X31_00845 [Elusimicrobia bacterium GWB2_63_22]|nr:MAG: hypothetical protein A2X31_00845 [Elusimicrobia bacterium GWB2_63_22]
MKNLVKIAVITFVVQAGLANAAPGAALQSGAARPVAVDISVGELSDASAMISAASAAGNDREAEQLLSQLFSGGVKAVKSEPVYAAKCCCHTAAVPQAAESVASSTATVAVTPAVTAAAPIQTLETWAEIAEKEKAEKAKKDADEEKEKARKQKQFNWGVTILAVALLLLFLL